MTPPIAVQHNGEQIHVDVHGQIPLAKWNLSKSFDSATDCEAYKEKLTEICNKNNDRTMFQVYVIAQRIETDDPRLKAKRRLIWTG
jgi:hypothetical protein